MFYHHSMAARNALFVLLLLALLSVRGVALVASRPALRLPLGIALPAVPYLLGGAVMVLGGWVKCPRGVLRVW